MAKIKVAGNRVGTKRRDMRWQAPDGTIWASKFEYGVYAAIKKQGIKVRKTGPEDSMAYESPIRNGRCKKCGAGTVVTERTFTPDLHVVPAGQVSANRRAYYIEAKGYIRAPRRTLLRSFRKSRPDVSLRLVFERDYPITKTMTALQWAKKYMKCPAIVWKGRLPNETAW